MTFITKVVSNTLAESQNYSIIAKYSDVKKDNGSDGSGSETNIRQYLFIKLLFVFILS